MVRLKRLTMALRADLEGSAAIRRIPVYLGWLPSGTLAESGESDRSSPSHD